MSANDLGLDQSTIERNLAEAEAFKAQAARDFWQAEYNKHSAVEQEAKTREYLGNKSFTDASDVEHRIYHLIGAIADINAHHCMEFLARWARQDIGKPVEVVISTLGGEVLAGMALADAILAHRQQGLQITGTVRGTAASMGAILLQVMTTRRVGPGSTLVLHKISAQVGGSLDQIEDTTNWLKLMNDRGVDMVAERCASAPNATRPMTRAQLVRGMNRKDWAIGPAEAVELGLADEIG